MNENLLLDLQNMVHENSLALRTIDNLIQTKEFMDFFNNNVDKQQKIVNLINEYDYKSLRKLITPPREEPTIAQLREEAKSYCVHEWWLLNKESLKREIANVKEWLKQEQIKRDKSQQSVAGSESNNQ